MGMQSGYTKYCCFLCEWDSRARQLHYVEKNWNPRQNLVPGIKNVSQRPLVDPQKVLLPPLHIKLGLIKNFVKGIVKYNKDGEGLAYLRSKFPGISDAKIKEGVFIGPEIRDLIHDVNFDLTLNALERDAWVAFKDVVAGFWGNHKSNNYKEIVDTHLGSYKAMGCNMSLKIHFLYPPRFFS